MNRRSNRAPNAVNLDMWAMPVNEPEDDGFSDELPSLDVVDDGFSNELPVMDLPKEYDVKERFDAVHAQMGRGYIAAYLVLNPDLPIDEFECRTNPDYIKWVYGKHNAFCKEHNINRKKVGYTAQNIMDFTDMLYSEI